MPLLSFRSRNPRNRPGHLLLRLDISLAGDHHALGLRGAGAVQGLGAVADGGCAETDVLQEAENFLAVLGGDAVAAREELVADLADGFSVFADYGVGGCLLYTSRCV